MKFVWAGDRHKKNSELIFTFLPKTECDLLVLNAVDYFRVFVDGEFTCFGPERTASGYSRTARIKLSSPKKIEIRVLGYNMAWLLKCIELGKQAGLEPEKEVKIKTNYIR